MKLAKWNGRGEAAASGLLLLCNCASVALALNLVAAANAAAQQRPEAQDEAKIAAGEKVYAMYCATRHGDNLVNTGQTFDLRRLRAEERLRFENSVHNGKNQMPPWRGVLSDEQIDELWHYIRAHAYQE
jgi:mono/diheme cytochrome c family protein